jgi:hypothetical protein
MATTSPEQPRNLLVEELLERNFYAKGQTGGQRISQLFKDIWKGETRAELQAVKMMGMSSAMIGASYGAVFRNTKLQEDFIRRHNHRVFLGLADAKRMYYDYLSLYALKSGLSYGVKCGMFGSLVGAQIVCNLVYRDDLRVIDCALGMGLMSSMTRISMGMRAMAASFLVGSIAGLLAGSMSKGALIASGITVHEMLVWANRDYFFERMALSQEAMVKGSTFDKDDFVGKKLASRPSHPF